MISLNGGINMSFNHGTSHLSGQQKAIIRQREKNDEIREQESKKQNGIICKPIESKKCPCVRNIHVYLNKREYLNFRVCF